MASLLSWGSPCPTYWLWSPSHVLGEKARSNLIQVSFVPEQIGQTSGLSTNSFWIEQSELNMVWFCFSGLWIHICAYPHFKNILFRKNFQMPHWTCFSIIVPRILPRSPQFHLSSHALHKWQWFSVLLSSSHRREWSLTWKLQWWSFLAEKGNGGAAPYSLL